MERLFVDTAGWYALLNQADHSHEKIKGIVRETDLPLVTSNFIVTELLNLMVARRQKKTALQFGKELREKSGVSIFPIERKDEESAWALFQKYHDKDFSFTDCTSFALMHRLQLKKVLTLDSDFFLMGFELLPGDKFGS